MVLKCGCLVLTVEVLDIWVFVSESFLRCIIKASVLVLKIQAVFDEIQ